MTGLLEADAPEEIQRLALIETALAAQDDSKYIRAEQIFGQYLHNYPEDTSAPEVLLRQGIVYRQMGVNTLAISKFYAVMGTALKLKLENMDYYKNLVLQAQVEIADTYYQEGKYDEAADFFSRLLKSGNVDLDQLQTPIQELVRFTLLHDQQHGKPHPGPGPDFSSISIRTPPKCPKSAFSSLPR